MDDFGVKIIISVHFFLSISYLFICASADGRKISTENTLVKHKNAIKTIQTEDGDIVDCVSLYKQPALNHPLLKNHKIQMRPNWHPERMKKDYFEIENKDTHAQLEIVQCPEGTIPILRTPKSISHLNPNAVTHLFNFTFPGGIQDAYFWLFGKGMYPGVESYINIWNPKVAADEEASGVYMWVQANYNIPRNINLAGAGWIVNPAIYGDNHTRLTAFWTKDDFIRTGCQDLRCPGFVQIDKHVYLGSRVKSVSSYGDQTQKYIQINIYKDKGNGNWWVAFRGQPVGYWPEDIFTGLQYAAEILSWGGKVTNSGKFGSQTFTEMGSGHFPEEGYSRACYIRNLNVLDSDYHPAPQQIKDLQAQVTNKMCYDANIDYNGKWGAHIYLGGNGSSNPGCQ